MEWKTWCSLCANIDTKQLVSKTPIKIINTIYKHFNVIHEAEQLKICLQCHEFLENFVRFEEICRKVQSMFEQISSNQHIDSKHLNDMRIDAGLDSGGIKIEAENELMNSWENVESLSFESHFIKEMEEDDLPCSPTHSESETERIESAIIEKNTPDDDSPIRNLRPRAKVETEATTSIIKRSNGRNASKKLAKNKQIKSKRKQQNDDLDDAQFVDQTKPMKGKRQIIREIRKPTKCLNLKCNLCDAVAFENKLLYQEHMHETHPDEIRIFNCLKCSASFERWSSFRRHETKHLPDDQRLIVGCDFCPKKFSNSSNAQIHVRVVHKNDEKNIICDQCGKAFINMVALKEHLVSHSDERPFKCDFENCGKSFKTKHMVKKHNQTHQTKRICDICGVGLSTRVTLMRHMLVHSNVKRFECKFCNQKFKRSKTLKVHLILHTGMRPYSCPFCEYTCPNGSNLRTHKKKYHSDELAKLEVSGQTLPAIVLPKLRELQLMNNGEHSNDSH